MKQEKEKQERAVSSAENRLTPAGLDIGTSRVVYADSLSEFSAQLNAFICVPYSKFAEQILQNNKMDFYTHNGEIVVYGDGAEKFANMLNNATRRPMRYGFLNPQEKDGFEILKSIVRSLLKKAKPGLTKICFSVPGLTANTAENLIYHEAMIKRFLADQGFQAKSVSEGLAVVFAELGDNNFTGIGVSLGGGLCNVCLAFLSMPIITFSFPKAGDWIDASVSLVTGEVADRVRVLKESSLDLSIAPRNRIEEALQIYYNELIQELVSALKDYLKTKNLPHLDKPIPVVLSGGTAKPRGFRDKFEEIIRRSEFPLEISEIKLAADPLNTTAKGALIAAMHDE